MAILGIIALAPLIVIAGALLRSVLLFWPVMIGLGALHSHIPAVPPLGWGASFWLVFVLSLLLDYNSSASSD